MPLAKGEQLELLLNVTAPEDSSPGEIPFSLRAVCPSCGQSLFGNDVISKKIDVPVLRELSMAAEELYVEAPANGNTRIVYVDLLNLGNDDEAYSLDLVESNWRLQASLSADETPVLDAWDGETSIALNLPMPIGLAPGLYTARITASSIDDPSVQEQITINVEVTNTSSAGVSDEVADQSYIPLEAPEPSDWNRIPYDQECPPSSSVGSHEILLQEPSVVPGISFAKLCEIVLSGAPFPLHSSRATKSPAPI